MLCGGKSRRVLRNVEDSQEYFTGQWKTVRDSVLDFGGESWRVLGSTVKESVVDCG